MDDTSDTFDGPPPPGIAKDDIIYDEENPNRARAVPPGEGDTVLERSRVDIDISSGTYPDIVEGSDSESTGTSWDIPATEETDQEP